MSDRYQAIVGGHSLEALLAGGHVLGRDVVAHQPIDELKVGAALLQRLDVPNHAGELPRAAALLLVQVVELRLLRDGLAIVNAGLAHLQAAMGAEVRSDAG